MGDARENRRPLCARRRHRDNLTRGGRAARRAHGVVGPAGWWGPPAGSGTRRRGLGSRTCLRPRACLAPQAGLEPQAAWPRIASRPRPAGDFQAGIGGRQREGQFPRSLAQLFSNAGQFLQLPSGVESSHRQFGEPAGLAETELPFTQVDSALTVAQGVLLILQLLRPGLQPPDQILGVADEQVGPLWIGPLWSSPSWSAPSWSGLLWSGLPRPGLWRGHGLLRDLCRAGQGSSMGEIDSQIAIALGGHRRGGRSRVGRASPRLGDGATGSGGANGNHVWGVGSRADSAASSCPGTLECG